MRPTLQIGARLVGADHPALLVAEVGANHDGSIDVAHQLIDAVADAGADAVKFQTYTAAELLTDGERVIEWGAPGKQHREPVGEMFDRLALPRSAHEELFRHAGERGLIAFSTPFSVEGAEFLADLGVPAFKIASSDVRYRDLLVKVARSGRPVILSTGKSTIEEVDRAVETLRLHGCQELSVLHCIAQYPAPIEEMNLRAIPWLANRFPDSVTGLSDHSEGEVAAVGAVSLGARVIEKHVTLDRRRDGPDHWFSADPPAFRRLVEEVRLLEAALGEPSKRVMPSEEDERAVSTRSLVVTADLGPGAKLEAHHLDALRPGTGIDPFEIEDVVGRTLRRAVSAGTTLTWDDLD